MALYVNDDVVRAATDCQKGMTCIAGDEEQLCRVEACMDGDIHFIACSEEKECVYMRAAEGRRVCDCPVRKEIYRKYKR